MRSSVQIATHAQTHVDAKSRFEPSCAVSRYTGERARCWLKYIRNNLHIAPTSRSSDVLLRWETCLSLVTCKATCPSAQQGKCCFHVICLSSLHWCSTWSTPGCGFEATKQKSHGGFSSQQDLQKEGLEKQGRVSCSTLK